MNSLPYRQIWCCDFEFTARDGDRPDPLCMVAREARTGELIRLWLTDGAPAAPPFPVGPDTLFVAYYNSAELGCFLALGWPFPHRQIDLCCEFRNATNGHYLPCGRGLLGALAYHGLDAIAGAEKEEMRTLALRGGPYTDAERLALLDYCQTDVDALVRLLPDMLPKIDVPRALLRGRFMSACARMEWRGTPVDTGTLSRLREHWLTVKSRLVRAVNDEIGVYVPSKSRTGDLSFSAECWADYVARKGIIWPKLDSGQPALDDETFREMARAYPKEVGPVRELRHTLSQLRLNDLTVGADGRNRCLLSAFASRTGRNQPSNSKFIFGPSTWLRSLIKPAEGRGLVYCDWSAQELGIAAWLSGDLAMQEAYQSGDPYIWLAKRVRAVPEGATKKTHAAKREQFKVVSLGVLYGLSDQGLARRLNLPHCYGRELLSYHRETFPTFWGWSDAVEVQGLLGGSLRTCFGWTLHAGPHANPRSLRNFPMQAHGAEMLRLACCLATERGLEVCCPVHDALLVEGPADDMGRVASETVRAMREASEVVLPGFSLRAEPGKAVTYPSRYSDPRGERMWSLVRRLLPP